MESFNAQLAIWLDSRKSGLHDALMQKLGMYWLDGLIGKTKSDPTLLQRDHLVLVQQSVEYEATELFEEWLRKTIPHHITTAITDGGNTFGIPVLPWYLSTRAFADFTDKLTETGLSWCCVLNTSDVVTEDEQHKVILMIMPAAGQETMTDLYASEANDSQ